MRMSFTFWTVAGLFFALASWAAIGGAVAVALKNLSRRELWIGLSVFLVVFASFSFRALEGGGLLVSDAVEYFSITRNSLVSGYTDLEFAGQTIPSRFQPWFSSMFLLPLHLLSDVSGFLAVSIAFTGALAVVGTGLLAMRAVDQSRRVAAFLTAATLVALIPSLRYFSLSLMTDVPAACLLVVVLLTASSRSRRSTLSSTGSVFVTTLLRPVVAVAAICGLIAKREWRKVGTGAVAIAVAMFAMAMVNLNQFGTIARSGYNFWMPLPYDSFWLVFNWGHVGNNIRELQNDPGMFLVLMGVVAPIALWSKLSLEGKSIARGFFAVTGVLFVVHIGYFYPSVRFFLPAQVLAAVVCSIVIFSLPLKESAIRAAPWIGLVLFAVLVFPKVERGDRSVDYAAITEINRCLPPDAMLITDRNLLLVETLMGEGEKKSVIPWSREQEYASKVVLWKKLEVIPEDAMDAWRIPEKVRRLVPQAQEVYPVTAMDSWGAIQADVGAGKKVFADVRAESLPVLKGTGLEVREVECGGTGLKRLWVR